MTRGRAYHHGNLRQSPVAAQAEGSVGPGDPGDMARTAWALLHGVAVLGVAGQLHADDPATVAGRAMRRLVVGREGGR